MMMMTICFNEATRLLEISRSAVSRWREEEQQQYKMAKRQITRNDDTEEDKYKDTTSPVVPAKLSSCAPTYHMY